MTGGKVEALATQGTCPYLQSLKERNTVSCECAKFKFPDKIARRKIVYAYCAHPTDFENCVFKRVLDEYYYERKYNVEFNK